MYPEGYVSGDFVESCPNCSTFSWCKSCRGIETIADAPEPEEPEDPERCQRCDADVVYRTGPFGPFTGCSRFPKCKCEWSV